MKHNLTILILTILVGCGQEQVEQDNQDIVTNSTDTVELIEYSYINDIDADTLEVQYKIDNELNYFIRKKEQTFHFDITGIPRDNIRLTGPAMTVIYPKDKSKDYRIRYDGWPDDNNTAIIQAFVIVQDTKRVFIKRIDIPVREKEK